MLSTQEVESSSTLKAPGYPMLISKQRGRNWLSNQPQFVSPPATHIKGRDTNSNEVAGGSSKHSDSGKFYFDNGRFLAMNCTPSIVSGWVRLPVPTGTVPNRCQSNDTASGLGFLLGLHHSHMCPEITSGSSLGGGGVHIIHLDDAIMYWVFLPPPSLRPVLHSHLFYVDHP